MCHAGPTSERLRTACGAHLGSLAWAVWASAPCRPPWPAEPSGKEGTKGVCALPLQELARLARQAQDLQLLQKGKVSAPKKRRVCLKGAREEAFERYLRIFHKAQPRVEVRQLRREWGGDGPWDAWLGRGGCRCVRGWGGPPGPPGVHGTSVAVRPVRASAAQCNSHAWVVSAPCVFCAVGPQGP